MTKTPRTITTPITPATQTVIDRLGYKYLLGVDDIVRMNQDIVRMNQVHLVCLHIMETDPWKTFQFYVRTAIEWLTIDHDIVHTDPYELWIDAGYFDSELNELP